MKLLHEGCYAKIGQTDSNLPLGHQGPIDFGQFVCVYDGVKGVMPNLPRKRISTDLYQFYHIDSFEVGLVKWKRSYYT